MTHHTGSDEGRATWSRMPLIAPAWLWIAYHLAMIVLAFMAIAGGLGGAFAVLAAAATSFQFWTFAAWNGRRRRNPVPHPAADPTEGDDRG